MLPNNHMRPTQRFAHHEQALKADGVAVSKLIARRPPRRAIDVGR